MSSGSGIQTAAPGSRSMNEQPRGALFGVAAYLILAFGLAWTSWMLLLPSSPSGNLVAFQIGALPGAFAPALATFIVRKWITREGFADAGLALNLRKWPYYLLAWFMPWAIVAALVTLAMGL